MTSTANENDSKVENMSNQPATVMILINAQAHFFTQNHGVYQAEAVLQNLKKLVQFARVKSIPICFIQNNGSEGDPDEPGSIGWYIHPEIAPQELEMVIPKDELDTFEKTQLTAELAKWDAKTLVIAGMQTEFDIATNCRIAKRHQFRTQLISDAHSTYDNGDESAADLIKELNTEMKLNESLLSTDEFMRSAMR